MSIRIIYMGTPELSATILEGLIHQGYDIVGVIAQEDKPVGRKNIIQKVPTKVVAEKYHIPVYQPHKIRLDYEFIKEINPDLIITCAYGQIVPQGLLDIPRLGCINVHGSILPMYRGASPIQSALIHGEKETGVTIMEMIDKMDAGRMIKTVSFPLEKEDNYTSTCVKMAQYGLQALLESLPNIINQTIEYTLQNEEFVTYCSKITKEQEHLDLSLSPEQFVNLVRGLSETPGGYLLLDQQVFKIYQAEVVSSTPGERGLIVQADKNGLILQLEKGQVALKVVQKQGKKKMDYKSFLNGEKNMLHKKLV